MINTKNISLIAILLFAGLALSGCVDQESDARIPLESAIGSISYHNDLDYITATIHVGQDGPVKYIAAKNTSIINEKTINGLPESDIYYVSGYYNPGEFMNYTSFQMANATADDISSPVLVLVDKEGNILDWMTIYTSQTKQKSFFMSSILIDNEKTEYTKWGGIFFDKDKNKTTVQFDIAEKDAPASVRVQDCRADKSLICEMLMRSPGNYNIIFMNLDFDGINATAYSLTGDVLANGTLC